MLRSMTGYGRGESLRHSRKIVVEIKSVNHRYNDMTIKMPRVMNCFEDRLRKQLSTLIQRGKTDVYVSMETFAQEDIKINVNEAVADAYVGAVGRLQARFNVPSGPTLSMIAGCPDVMTIERNADDEKALSEIWEALEAAAEAALGQFIAMRETEGASLKADILAKSAAIAALVVKMKAREPAVSAAYAARLKARISEMLESTTVDENRVLTEVAVFAERACIDEEIIRFDSHLAQMEAILALDEAVGRKLDFLVQEMNREINTIGSKSNDIEMTRIVVDLKSEVEKIREQIQNIE